MGGGKASIRTRSPGSSDDAPLRTLSTPYRGLRSNGIPKESVTGTRVPITTVPDPSTYGLIMRYVREKTKDPVTKQESMVFWFKDVDLESAVLCLAAAEDSRSTVAQNWYSTSQYIPASRGPAYHPFESFNPTHDLRLWRGAESPYRTRVLWAVKAYTQHAAAPVTNVELARIEDGRRGRDVPWRCCELDVCPRFGHVRQSQDENRVMDEDDDEDFGEAEARTDATWDERAKYQTYLSVKEAEYIWVTDDEVGEGDDEGEEDEADNP